MQVDDVSRRQFLSLAAIGALSSIAAPRWARAAESDADARKSFFTSGKVATLSIEIAKADYDSLRRDPRKYVKVQITEDGKTVHKDIGIHVKGAAGSSRPIDDKAGLTLNCDKFVDDQRFRGMDKFHLNNSVQDPSYLSDLLCGEMFRAAGVPASLIGHAHVTINGKKRGFYVLKEGFDKTFLKTHFGNSDGNFYDGGFLRDLDQPLQLVTEGKDDVKDRADLKAVLAAANDGDANRRFPKLEKLLDMDRFISYLALEVFSWDWDGYPMQRNNYRIYHDPKPNKITFIPSGMDQMWGEPNGPLFPNFNGVVARTVIQSPEGRKRYLARMTELLKDGAMPETLVKRLEELQPRVQEALAVDNEGEARNHRNHMRRLRDGIRQRAKSLGEQLAKAKA